MEQLQQVFESFCSFGGSKGNLSAGIKPSLTPDVTMTNQKFAKFCKDCDVHKDGISSTDTDIIYNKVKAKTERNINFSQFTEALRQIAVKRFPKAEPAAAFDQLVAKILKSGGCPKIQDGTRPVNDAVTSRLTDHSQYTGTHKNRFDADGKGKGKDGRTDKFEGVMTMKNVTNRKEADVRGVQRT
ncbi:hypothetical protein HDV03_005333 [Kappamyces sp. JEL0829]|nr:hypothetical protein HDV03_005333 [Kappamyces sp. JEL0829]